MHSLQGLCPSMLLWVHSYVDQDNVLIEDNTSCIGCRRCSALCPTGAITIRSNEEVFKKNESWSTAHIRNLYAQADTGGILLAAWAIRPNIPFIGIICCWTHRRLPIPLSIHCGSPWSCAPTWEKSPIP